jgi:hypothetical protein
MPTARELLEQADALMRRNRADQVDDIPVLTDAVPSLAEAPMRALAATPAAVPADLRDAGPASVPVRPGRDTAAEGEPSNWLEIEDAEPSIIGDAPDSVAIVPPVELRRAVDQDLLQSAEHEEIELTSAADDRLGGDSAPADLGPQTEFDEAPPSVPLGEGTYQETNASAAPGQTVHADDESVVEVVELAGYVERAPVVPSEPVPSEPAPAAGPGDFDVGRTEGLEPAIAPAAIPSAAALAASFAAAIPAETVPPASLGPDTRWPDAPVPPPEAIPPDHVTAGAGALPAAPLGPDDQAHWDSVAEEIRMQVLQRIDLFTDTGLREQLGERLKPIVDRASADLVATINQHVGELLRAYVAEAIEREIERWRQDN